MCLFRGCALDWNTGRAAVSQYHGWLSLPCEALLPQLRTHFRVNTQPCPLLGYCCALWDLVECNGILGTGPNPENPTILLLPIPCLFRPPHPIFKLLSGWLKQYTRDHCAYSVACVSTFDTSLLQSCSLAKPTIGLMELLLLSLLAEATTAAATPPADASGRPWGTGMDKDEDKSAALGETLLGLASSIKYWCFGFIKSLSTSRKKICCCAGTVSLRTSGWQEHLC